jgi:DNA modification methylase
MPTATTLAALTADPHNRRTHPARNLALIAQALTEVGAARSIVIDETDTILAGNGVVQAAPQAGLTKLRIVEAAGDELIAVRRRGLTDAQKRALAIFDNRTSELATWHVEQLLADQQAELDLATFWTDDELAALLAANGAPKEGLTDPDAVPEVRATEIQRGDLFELGAHRLLCGDSTVTADVARVMGADRADSVFTSPPYGVGIEYGTYQDTIENLRNLLAVLPSCWNLAVVDGGFAVVNFGDIVGGSARSNGRKKGEHKRTRVVESNGPCEYPMALEYWPTFRAADWVLWSRRVWCKPSARTGSMQCIGSNRSATNWEHLWTWKRPGQPILRTQTSGTYPSQWGWISSVGAQPLVIDAAVHGAEMPVFPALYSIANHTRPDHLVHEPFCGTGTTLVACEQLGRACRAIEIEPQYCQVTIDRWAAFTGQTPQKVGEAVRAPVTRRTVTRGHSQQAQTEAAQPPAGRRRRRR